MTSLRWYEPDQVLRVKSQPHCVKKRVTPRVNSYYDPLMPDDQLILLLIIKKIILNNHKTKIFSINTYDYLIHYRPLLTNDWLIFISNIKNKMLQ